MSEKRLQSYKGEGFLVTFDPAMCQHSGVCVRTLNAVFDIKKARWINTRGAPADQIAATIAKCPSGALQFYSSAS